MYKEFAQTAEDVIWRRSKLGLRLTDAQIERLQSWMHPRPRKQARMIKGKLCL
jgi:glycerol-3-phosphate dehydrogenase